MRFAIIEKNDEESQAAKEKIVTAFTKADFVYDEQTPELVISIGGDGTLLKAFHAYQQQLTAVKFVGIHSGSLGFYTDWLLSEIDMFITAVLENEPVEEMYPLLQAELLVQGEKKSFLALNEVSLVNYHKTLALNVYIDEHLFEAFKGTGLCISTPSGSTGYNKSLGGAIVHPSLETFQLTEIASINNTVYRTLGSALILAKNESIRLALTSSVDDWILTVDHFVVPLNADDAPNINVRMAREKMTFARYRQYDFWERTRRSFIAQQ